MFFRRYNELFRGKSLFNSLLEFFLVKENWAGMLASDIGIQGVVVDLRFREDAFCFYLFDDHRSIILQEHREGKAEPSRR